MIITADFSYRWIHWKIQVGKTQLKRNIYSQDVLFWMTPSKYSHVAKTFVEIESKTSGPKHTVLYPLSHTTFIDSFTLKRCTVGFVLLS